MTNETITQETQTNTQEEITLLKCSVCNCIIENNQFIQGNLTNNNIYCYGCYGENFFCCDDCGLDYSNNNACSYDEYTLCSDCYDTRTQQDENEDGEVNNNYFKEINLEFKKIKSKSFKQNPFKNFCGVEIETQNQNLRENSFKSFEEIKKFNFSQVFDGSVSSGCEYISLALINHYYKKAKPQNEIKKVKYAIKETTKRLNGYYSIFLYNLRDKSLFYFKESKANINFIIYDKKVLIATTNDDNLKYIYCDKEFIVNEEKIKEIEINEETIYLISSNNIKEIGKFKDGILKDKYKAKENETIEIKQNYKDYENSFNSGNYENYKGYENDIITNEEIDNIFMEKLSFIPRYKIEKDKIIILEDNFLQAVKYVCNKFRYENNKIVFNIDDFINENLEILYS